MIIKRITKFSQSILKDLNSLLMQLSSSGYQMTENRLKEVVKNKSSYLMVMCDGNKIIGTATLVAMFLIRDYKGYVENVVVDEKYRNKGWGKKLVSHIITLAESLKIEKLELKSEPHRVVANILYKKLGFKEREATCYQKNLD